MLRRKILTSAMASVMALTSISAVAFADETATDVKNVKTKADLEALVKSYDSFRDKEINEVGSIAGERALGALEYADNVLDDGKSTVDDYTVAYKMIEETMKKCVLHTSSELRDLIKTCEKTYEQNNILNEDLDDLVYDEEKFAAFSSAFDYAESYVGSNDSRLITDAWEELDQAWAELKNSAKVTVTKAQFRTALKNYEKMIGDIKKYDSWRRGSIDGWVDLTTQNYWAINGDNVISFGMLLEILTKTGSYATDDVIQKDASWDPAAKEITSWCASAILPITTLDFSSYNGANGVIVGKGESLLEYATDTVENLINVAYKDLNDVKGVSKTSADVYVKAYQSATEAVTIFNNWKADDTNRAGKATVQKLLDTYHSQLVRDFRTSEAESLYEFVSGKAAPDDWDDLKNDNADKKAHNIKVDANGYAVFEDHNYTNTGVKDQKIAYRNSILKYVEVTSDDIDATSDADLQRAIYIAEQYLSGSEGYDVEGGVYGLDETGAVPKNSKGGSTVEWTLVYRNLKYALEDKYPAADASHTKKEVEELIELAYDLADKTGDSPVFALTETTNGHKKLVNERQAAIDWVREARKDKGYKDGNAVLVDGVEKTATDVYNSLHAVYEDLEKLYADYKYSYEEIYNKISDVCDQLDSGKLVANDDLINALNDTAYNLSILDAEKVTNEENEAFTSDRFFNDFNRLHTAKDKSAVENGYSDISVYEKNLKETYEKLVAEVDKQINPDAKLGDVNKDGAINAIDAALILKAAADGTVDTLDKAVADFNTDGAINALDAAAILKGVAAGTLK